MKSAYLNLAHLRGENQASQVDKPIYCSEKTKPSKNLVTYLLVGLPRAWLNHNCLEKNILLELSIKTDVI